MTDIALKIKIDGDKCDSGCPFYDHYFLDDFAVCLMFGGMALRSHKEHGHMCGSYRCEPCQKITDRQEIEK